MSNHLRNFLLKNIFRKHYINFYYENEWQAKIMLTKPTLIYASEI